MFWNTALEHNVSEHRSTTYIRVTTLEDYSVPWTTRWQLLTVRETDITCNFVEAARPIRIKLNKLKAIEAAQKQAFEKYDAFEPADDAIKTEEAFGDREPSEDVGETFEDSRKTVAGLLSKYLGNLLDFINEFDTTYGIYLENGNLMMGNCPITVDYNLMIVWDESGKTVCEYCITKVTHKCASEEDVSNCKEMLVTMQSAFTTTI